jgi:hypothetical protein
MTSPLEIPQMVDAIRERDGLTIVYTAFREEIGFR